MTSSVLAKHILPAMEDAVDNVRQFETDLLAMFTFERQGHMEQWSYAEADYPGDPASGQYFFEQLVKYPGTYYVPQADFEMLGRVTAHSGVDAILSGIHTLVELGPGSMESVARKTIPFLNYAKEYVAVDRSLVQAQQAANQVQATLGIPASVRQEHYLRPGILRQGRPRTGFLMLGGSLGNLEGRANEDVFPKVIAALKSLADRCNTGDTLFMSIDTETRREYVMNAYNVPFMSQKLLSILHDAKRLGIIHGKFTPETWTHRSLWHADANQIAMYLIPGEDQDFIIAGERIKIPVGRATIAINSYKFPHATIESAAKAAGFSRVMVTDDRPMALLVATK